MPPQLRGLRRMMPGFDYAPIIFRRDGTYRDGPSFAHTLSNDRGDDAVARRPFTSSAPLLSLSAIYCRPMLAGDARARRLRLSFDARALISATSRFSSALALLILPAGAIAIRRRASRRFIAI